MKLAECKTLSIAPQTPIEKESVKPGPNPTIDFFLNGRLNMYLELTKDSSKLKHHFDKFETGVYRGIKNYAILDIVIKGDEPKELPPKYSHLNDKYFSFVKQKNALYHNGKLVRSNVSTRLKSPRYFSTSLKAYVFVIGNSLFSLSKLV
jgi:hypothetical protein